MNIINIIDDLDAEMEPGSRWSRCRAWAEPVPGVGAGEPGSRCRAWRSIRAASRSRRRAATPGGLSTAADQS
jgi:hypothetical protein